MSGDGRESKWAHLQHKGATRVGGKGKQTHKVCIGRWAECIRGLCATIHVILRDAHVVQARL